MKRFASFTSAEIAEKRSNFTPKATEKTEQFAAKTFREYLKEKEENENFESFPKSDLDKRLSSFYLKARTKKGELYKKTSLDLFRYSLNRYIKKQPGNQTTMVDLLTDPAFAKSNESFQVAMREIKAEGKAEIQHFPPLSDIDREKLYKSIYFNTDTPTGLFNKVQFDVRFYFCRRGAEGMHAMKKDSFILNTDPDSGRR